MKLTAIEDEKGARTLIVDYEEQMPSKDSAQLIEAAHRWMWEPFERRQKERDEGQNPGA